MIAAIRAVHSGDAVIASSTPRRLLDHLGRGDPRPRDDGERIIRKLRRGLGEGNYDFVHMISG